MARWTAWIAGCLALGAHATIGRAATLVVPTDQPSIQRAVDAAGPGDTVLVRGGSYFETVRVSGARSGLTIEAADADDPPILVGSLHRSDDAIRIDRVDDVTIRNLRIRDANEGVRVTNSNGALLVGLRIENAGLAIRLSRGRGHRIAQCDVRGTRLSQGIAVERTVGAAITDVAVADASREGIRVLGAFGTSIERTTITDSHGSDGLKVVRSAAVEVRGCTATGHYHDGMRLQASPGLVLADNVASGNASVGLRIERCVPFLSVADVVASGNRASGNRRHEIVVTKPGCAARGCAFPSTTTTTTSTTTTTLWTRPEPGGLGTWRLRVRTASAAGGLATVDVPLRPSDPPVPASILAEHLAAFAAGPLTGDQVEALGDDTLVRLVGAAASYIRAHPDDYPRIVAVTELRRAELVGPACGAAPCASTTTTVVTPTTGISNTTTTVVTPTEPASWRLYVRTRLAQSGIRDVNVPFRSIEAPLVVAIRADRLSVFRIGDQVTGDEIEALHDDTLDRFTSAAAAWIAGHPDDYPGIAAVTEVRWAMRVAP